jgi:hypothetical protein
VKRGVQGTVSAGVEPVPDVLPAGGFQRCRANIAGEMVFSREAIDVADVAEDPRGEHGAQARQRRQRGL